MMLILLLACAADPTGPESIGKPTSTTTVLASPGDEGVELLTWALPEEGTTTGITFVLLIPEADAIGAIRWIPDVYTWTQKDYRTPPVRTEVQNAIELCWLVEESGEVIEPNKEEKPEVMANTSALPDGLGEVSFRRFWKRGGTVSLVCSISAGASKLTIGVNMHDLENHGELDDSEDMFQWRDTYNNGNAWSDPARRVVIQ